MRHTSVGFQQQFCSAQVFSVVPTVPKLLHNGGMTLHTFTVKHHKHLPQSNLGPSILH